MQISMDQKDRVERVNGKSLFEYFESFDLLDSSLSSDIDGQISMVFGYFENSSLYYSLTVGKKINWMNLLS